MKIRKQKAESRKQKLAFARAALLLISVFSFSNFCFSQVNNIVAPGGTLTLKPNVSVPGNVAANAGAITNSLMMLNVTAGKLALFDALKNLTNSTLGIADLALSARLINTTGPLAGGGDLSADRTLTISNATALATGAVKPDGTTITVAAGGIISAVGATVPTGTGFPHITAGVQDAAAKLVETADVAASLGLTTPNIGVATATSVNKVIITQPATSATLTILNNKTLTANNSLTLAGTDTTTQTFPSTSGNIFSSVSPATTVQAGFRASDVGSTDDYVITLAPAITAYTVGDKFSFYANTSNTGAATLNINGLGVKNIAKVSVLGGSNTPLDDGDIQAGQWVDVVYTGIRFQMQSRLSVQRFKSYLKFNYPRRVDGAGVTIPNTNDFTLPTFMIPRFSGTAVSNANYCRFATRVPKDFDVNVVPTASLTVRLTAADTAAHIYNVGFASVANSAISAATAGTWIKLDVAADASGASDDVESVSNVALTGWNTGSTAGQWWVIELNRAGATDASTVASELLELEIEYSAVQ